SGTHRASAAICATSTAATSAEDDRSRAEGRGGPQKGAPARPLLLIHERSLLAVPVPVGHLSDAQIVNTYDFRL
ncbi:hypothetical protein, partial [Streptomyces klenkii]